MLQEKQLNITPNSQEASKMIMRNIKSYLQFGKKRKKSFLLQKDIQNLLHFANMQFFHNCTVG